MFPFSLNQTIGSSYPADPDDVLRTKKGLNRLGFYSVPKEYGMTPWTDDELFEGLKNFQRKNGLAVDGIMNPGGPTQAVLRRRLSGRKDERDLIPKSFAPRSGLGKGEQNREEDVLGLRRGLAGLGLMPRGEAVSEETLFDGPLEKAVKALQRNHGLKEDGVIRPKGPTLEALANRLKNLVEGDDDDDEKPKPKPKVPPKPSPNLLNLVQAMKAKDDDGGEEPGDPPQDPDKPDNPNPDDPDKPDPDDPDRGKCEEIREKLDEVYSKLDELRTRNDAIENEEIPAKEKEIEAQKAKLAEAQDVLSDLEAQLMRAEAYGSNKVAAGKLYNLRTQKLNEIEAIRKKIGQLETKLEGLKKDLQSNKDRIEELEEKRRRLHDKYAGCKE